MHILVLTNKIPYPPIDGGSIAVLNLSLALSKLNHSVCILAMNTAKHYFPTQNIPEEITSKIDLAAVNVPAKIKALGAIKNLLFSSKPYTIDRFISGNYQSKLHELLVNQHFDIVQLEGLYLGYYVPLIRKFSKAKIIYRAHNLEFEIWQRASTRMNFIKKWYFKNLSGRLLNFEKDLVSKCNGIMAISNKDKEWFENQVPKQNICTVSAGIDFEYFSDYHNNEPDLFYIGALDWLPNQEGLLWFFKHVWPEINLKYPHLKFYLAGRNPSKQMKLLKAKNLVFLGEIEHAKDFIKAHSILIIPLFSGSGIRIKIIEAMAFGKAVITTSLGLEGNPAEHQQEVVIANTADEFLSGLDYLLAEKQRIVNLGNKASRLVHVHFNQQKLAEKAMQFYRSI
jgi:glycosyltransferase involved in cell wall biosynthesis